jgi:hypothetical protein
MMALQAQLVDYATCSIIRRLHRRAKLSALCYKGTIM